MTKNIINPALLNKPDFTNRFSIEFCKDNKLKFIFEIKPHRFVFKELNHLDSIFLKDFLNYIYYYLISYEKKEIQHNGYYSSSICTEKK